jgi:xanthine dehydrogenase accessory factor
MRELLTELTAALEQGRACVYCAVVETRGSTPQKAGAAMLVFPDGGQRGTLGGGCVEAEVRQRALRVLSDGAGRPELLTFCLDDDYGWDDGLICGGRMTILADPVGLRNADRGLRTGKPEEYYAHYQRMVVSGQGCTEVVALADNAAGATAGTRFLFDESANLVGQLGAGPPGEVARDLRPLSERPQPAVQRGLSYLPHLPRITLLIVGGGHVGAAVGRLAADVDFDVWVLDDRERYASRERFPTAQRRIVGDIGAELKKLAPALGGSTFVIIVTRGHNHDEEALYHLAPTEARYVGMIGSRRKIKLIFEDLVAKGITPEVLARVHAPLGFDIGSQTVPEIALSIVAELIACRNLGSTRAGARSPDRAPGGAGARSPDRAPPPHRPVDSESVRP